MKFSIYNHITRYEFGYIFYNTYSDQIIAITEDVYRLIMQYNSSPQCIQDIHPELYKALWDYHYIVDKNFDEYENTVNELIDMSHNGKTFHLTINPTMDCNFRCWYCYEEHNSGSAMDANTIGKVQKLITNIVSNANINRLVLSFFGGEPLMHYKRIMKPLLIFAHNECLKRGKQFDVYITSNGYLMKEDIIKDLTSYPYVSLQIPFDGDKDLHDSVKFLANKSGTFDKVLYNTKKAIEAGLDVTIRCNYTLQNIDSFVSLKNIFKEYIKQNNLNFSFHKIWQEELTADLIDKFDKVFNGFRIEGFNTQTNLLNKGLCYADQDHSATINFNGDVFKCTARDFLPDNRLGVLLDDGTISWGEVYKTRQDSKYKSKTCRTCKLFPICMQGCSQNAFENIGNDSCNLGYTEDYINKIISDRIRYLLK